MSPVWQRLRPKLRKSFALNLLDWQLEDHLGMRGGFFVEAGANDGVTQSNTLYLEKYCGWTGLLVEPLPELAARCRVHRPNCLVENCALVPFDHPDSSVEMRACNLMSVMKGGMKSEEEELRHVATGARVQQVVPFEVRVPARPLGAILDEHGTRHIDLLSLDVEGFELGVLKGIDFDKHRPTFMAIEARYREEIDSFLRPLYEVVAELSHHDVLYRLKGARRIGLFRRRWVA